jgi:hypothetical protein
MPRSSKPRRRPVTRMQRPPSAHQVCTTFAPVFGFLSALRTGEVWCTDGGQPIMPVWGGDLYEACPALDGWISCWQRIVDGERLEIDLQPLRELHDRLRHGEMLTLELVDHCRQVTYACRKAYGRMPRARAKSYSLTELIAVEVDVIGLSGQADKFERNANGI